jgi:hypothetical protein
MRDYMSPAVKHVTSVIQHPSTIMAMIIKRRAVAFAIAATLLVVVITAFMLAKNSNQAQAVHNDAITGTTQPSLDTKVTANQEGTQPVADGGTTMSDSSNGGSNSSQSNTNVTVNNQSIDVPKNGSVTKTIQNGNGTTTVNVSNTSTTNGDSNSTTSSTLNVNTHTSSRTSKSSSSSP